MQNVVSRSRFKKTVFVAKMLLYTSLLFAVALTALLFFAKIDETVIARGKVYPRHDVEVRALDSGVLVEVYADINDVVKEGQVLAKYDDKEIRDELEATREKIVEAEARLAMMDKKLARLRRDPLPEKLRFSDMEAEIALSQLNAAKKELDRLTPLYKQGIVSQAEYDSAQSRYEVALRQYEIAKGKQKIIKSGLREAIIAEQEAERELVARQLMNLKRQCKRVEERLERTLVKAPVRGTIIQAEKDPGEAVTPGELLFVIAKDSSAEIHLYVPEEKIFKVAVGQEVWVYPAAFDYRKYGKATARVAEVSRFGREHDGKQYFWVRAVVEDSPYQLPFGSSVTAYIVVAERHILDLLLDRD